MSHLSRGSHWAGNNLTAKHTTATTAVVLTWILSCQPCGHILLACWGLKSVYPQRNLRRRPCSMAPRFPALQPLL